MPLESASYLHQLEPSNPAPTDQLRQADDHIRLIKQVLQDTFPNIAGAVTSTHTELNGLYSEPIGVIKLWYGSLGTIPTGYAACQGQTLAKSDGSGNITLPDLRDKVVIGAGTVAAQGASAGAATASTTISTAADHTHSTPAHTHTFAVSGGTTSASTAGSLSTTSIDVDDSAGSPAPVINSVSLSSTSHTHTYGGASGTTDASAAGTSGAGGSHTHTATNISTYQPSLGLHYIMRY